MEWLLEVFATSNYEKNFIREGVTAYNLPLYLLEHRNNRVYNQWLNKFIMNQTGTDPAEKFKFVEQDFPNIALLTQGNQV